MSVKFELAEILPGVFATLARMIEQLEKSKTGQKS
jgi:hypothetical protein